MKTGINLRSDLAKLSDAELAQRLEDHWRIVEANPKSRWSRWWGSPFRGPIRHPRAYRFLAAMGVSGSRGNFFDFLSGLVFSGKATEKLLRKEDPWANSHLSWCEIRDIVDEIERRVKQKQRQAQ